MSDSDNVVPEVNVSSAVGGIGGDLPVDHDLKQSPDVDPKTVEESMSLLPPKVRSRGPSKGDIDELKSNLLSMLRRFWPNTSRALAMMGISNKTFHGWTVEDKDFADKLNDIKREILDEMEGFGAALAMTPKGFMYWIATLRAQRPERWNPNIAKTILRELPPEPIEQRRANLADVIAADAEIIEATTGHAPPTLPQVEAISPDREPGIPVEDQVSKTPVDLPTVEKTQGGGETTVETVDGAGPLDIGEDFLQTFGVDELDPTSLKRQAGGRKAPQKKPTRPDSISTPTPSSPSKKSKRTSP